MAEEDVISELEALVESEQDRANENARKIHELRKRVSLLEKELLKVTNCCCPRCDLTWTEPCILDDEDAFNRFGNKRRDS